MTDKNTGFTVVGAEPESPDRPAPLIRPSTLLLRAAFTRFIRTGTLELRLPDQSVLRFPANRDRVEAWYDARFCRMWEFYLAACEASFRYRGQTVFQIQLTRKIGVLSMIRNDSSDVGCGPECWDDAEASVRVRGDNVRKLKCRR